MTDGRDGWRKAFRDFPNIEGGSYHDNGPEGRAVRFTQWVFEVTREMTQAQAVHAHLNSDWPTASEVQAAVMKGAKDAEG